jgi:hypothetical protein
VSCRSRECAETFQAAHVASFQFLGTVSAMTDYNNTAIASAELLFDVISTTYKRTSPIVTGSLTFEFWTEVLGSERLTSTTLDRLTHR